MPLTRVPPIPAPPYGLLAAAYDDVIGRDTFGASGGCSTLVARHQSAFVGRRPRMRNRLFARYLNALWRVPVFGGPVAGMGCGVQLQRYQ
jgi:hypothetical protein